MTWLGRGFEDVPGKPFGWAWHQERAEILVHLQRKDDGTLKGAKRAWATHRGLGYEFRITQIQDRIHRNKPTLRERQLATGTRRPNPTPRFTAEELAMIAERFAGANDPLGQAIEQKASQYVP